MLRTVNGKLIDVEKLVGFDVLSSISCVNAEMAQLIKELLTEDQEYNFYKASYPFGAQIIDRGKCYFPLYDGGKIAFNDVNLPQDIVDDLSYNSDSEDPLALILNKTSEFYLPTRDFVQPHSLITSGQMFGVPRAVDITGSAAASILSLNLNAGARSIFMLSKIGDRIFHSRLQTHYGINTQAPESMLDHWSTFVEIAKCANCPWRVEVIYFSRKFIQALKTPKYATLANYIIRMHRASYNVWHNQTSVWSTAWYDIEQMQHLNSYSMYSLNTAKHLFTLAANSAIGFKPATNDDSSPIGLITDAYLNIYKIAQKNNSAIIMEPTKFDEKVGDPIYYSLIYPTIVPNSLEASGKKSHITLLEEIRYVTEVYTKEILATKQRIKSLYNIAKNIRFTYYHTTPKDYKHITNVESLLAEDPRFTRRNHPGELYNSHFFKGCIRIASISPKKDAAA